MHNYKLYKRGEIWWVRIGRKTRQSTGTTDKGEAEEFAERLRERVWRLGKLGERGSTTWKDATVRWLKDSARPRDRDRAILKTLAPRLDAEPVSAVADPAALEELRQFAAAGGFSPPKEDGTPGEGWSHATIDRMMGTVGAVLRKCVAWRLLDHAPSMPKYRAATPEATWLSREQFARLVRELPPHLALAARFAVLTMLRMRAMGQLTWDRVDLKAKRAWIPRGHQKAGRTFGFPLSTEAVEVLEKLRALNPEGDRVFQYEGRPIDNFNTAAFKKAVTRAKVGPLHWHCLRHTGASWAVQAGVTMQELMQLGDWKSYSMVLRYSHLAPDHLAQAAELVAQKSHTRKAA